MKSTLEARYGRRVRLTPSAEALVYEPFGQAV